MKETEFMEKMNVTLGVPEEFEKELPEQEIIYDWDGGALDEIEQNA